MRLGFDASRTYTAGGVEEYGVRLFESMAPHLDPSWTVEAYIPNDGRARIIPAAWTKRIVKTPFGRLWTLLGLSWEILRRPPDLLFVPSHTLPLVLPRLVATTIHDVSWKTNPESYSLSQRLYLEWSTKRTLKYAQVIFCVSETAKQEIIKYFGKPKKGSLVVTPLAAAPVFTQQKQSQDQAILEKYQLFGKQYVLSVGRIEEKKNTRFTWEVFQELALVHPELKLVLVGRLGFGGAELMQEINQSQFTARVVHLQNIPQEEIAALYRYTAAFLFPSRAEGFGLVLIEAQKCGAPVFANDIAVLREVGGPGPVYLSTAQKDNWVKNLAKHLENPVLTNQNNSLTQQHLAKYSWEYTASKTIDNLKSMQ